MKPRVYVETSVLSYLTASPTRDLVQAAHQHITIEWWSCRTRFELAISEAVLAEVSRGDPEAANRRLAVAAELAVLATTVEAQSLARQLLAASVMPPNAAIDAAHVAIATVHGMNFLLTWNCAHIENAVMRERIEAVCRRAGFRPPVICTPEELMLLEDS